MTVPRSTPASRPRRSIRALAATAGTVALVPLASACGTSAGDVAGSSPARTASTSSSGAPVPSPTPGAGAGGRIAGSPCVSRPGSVCLTETARGHTVQLTVGALLTLRLGAPGRRFSAPRQYGGDALQALGEPHRNGTEVISSFRAVRPGTVALRATEAPVCRRGRLCPDYLALWTLSVRVSRRR